MKVQRKSFFIAAAAAAAIVVPAHAAGLKQVGTISLPGDPPTDIGVIAIDQASGLGYLADKTNKSVVVFDTKTDTFVSRIGGFVGLMKNSNASGPNGIAVVNDGAELWVSDGDSTIKIIDPKTGKIVETISTGGTVRANAMAVGKGVVIVANSNDDPPYLSFVSTEPGHKILGKIPVPESGENLERSAYHAASGTFFTVIPVQRGDITKGFLAQTDPKTGKMVKLHDLDNCHAHSLSIVSDTTIFLGCSTVHAPTPKPGGDLAVFDIPGGKVSGYGPGLGGNGSSATNLGLGQYYHATTGGTLMVVDTKTQQPVQKVPTSNGARSLGVSLANNRVYVATTAKDTPCVGCIVVYAPE
jgi:WD40 repeat protein